MHNNGRPYLIKRKKKKNQTQQSAARAGLQILKTDFGGPDVNLLAVEGKQCYNRNSK